MKWRRQIKFIVLVLYQQGHGEGAIKQLLFPALPSFRPEFLKK
jgi:hypothetical protein